MYLLRVFEVLAIKEVGGSFMIIIVTCMCFVFRDETRNSEIINNSAHSLRKNNKQTIITIKYYICSYIHNTAIVGMYSKLL